MAQAWLTPPSSRKPSLLLPPVPSDSIAGPTGKRQSSINPRRRSPDLAEYGFRRHFV
nr:MAG TPA: hypothetical protein [Bacteriophage sp.]